MMRCLLCALALTACGPDLASGIHIDRVEAHQAPGVPLWLDGHLATAEERVAPVLRDRDVWMLVHVDVDDDWQPREVEAVLDLLGPDGQWHRATRRRWIERSTEDWAADPAGGLSHNLGLDDFEGFGFGVDASLVAPGLAWQVELREVDGPVGSVRSTPPVAPVDGAADMGVEAERRTLKLELQPYDLDFNGCQKVAAVDEEAMRPFMDHMLSLLPFNDVDVRYPEPVKWTAPSNRSAMLNALTTSRFERSVPTDVYTYGVFEYCPDQMSPPSPIGGANVAPQDVPPPEAAPFLNAMVTRGNWKFYEDYRYEDYVFTHELAHLLGRAHGPCGNPRQPDADYPYEQGRIGTWGYEARPGPPAQPRGLPRHHGLLPGHVGVAVHLEPHRRAGQGPARRAHGARVA